MVECKLVIRIKNPMLSSLSIGKRRGFSVVYFTNSLTWESHYGLKLKTETIKHWNLLHKFKKTRNLQKVSMSS